MIAEAEGRLAGLGGGGKEGEKEGEDLLAKFLQKVQALGGKGEEGKEEFREILKEAEASQNSYIRGLISQVKHLAVWSPFLLLEQGLSEELGEYIENGDWSKFIQFSKLVFYNPVTEPVGESVCDDFRGEDNQWKVSNNDFWVKISSNYGLPNLWLERAQFEDELLKPLTDFKNQNPVIHLCNKYKCSFYNFQTKVAKKHS